MARIKDNLYTEGATGAVGKQIVYKEINGNTFMSKYPDMSQVKYNKTQKKYQSLFAQAVAYAKNVCADPTRSEAYRNKIQNDKRHRYKSVYHFALQCYIKKFSRKVPDDEVQKTMLLYLDKYKFKDRQIAAMEYLVRHKKLTNALYQQLNKVSRITASRDLQDLIRKQAVSLQGKGAGAVYNLVPIPTLHEAQDEDDEPDEENELI